MPIPKKYEFKTEEPYGWLSPGLRESLSDTIERITENNRKKEEAKQRAAEKDAFMGKQKKPNAVKRTIQKIGDSEVAQGIREYVNDNLEDIRGDFEFMAEPFQTDNVFVNTVFSGLTPSHWGRTIQDVARGEKWKDIHSPFSLNNPGIEFTGDPEEDANYNFLFNLTFPYTRFTEGVNKVATPIGKGVTRGAQKAGNYAFDVNQRITDLNMTVPETEYIEIISPRDPNISVTGTSPEPLSTLILPANELAATGRRGLVEIIQQLPNYTTLASEEGHATANILSLNPLQKVKYAFTGKLPTPPRSVEGYSLDVAKVLYDLYKHPDKAKKRGIRVEIDPTTRMSSTNDFSQNYEQQFGHIFGEYPMFDLMTPEQIKFWNHNYTEYPPIDPKTKTMPYFIFRKIPRKKK